LADWGLRGDRVGEGDRERLPDRAEQGDEGAPPASPWFAVGTMTVVALVAALAVLGWARLRPGAEAAPAPGVFEEDVPTELAGGEPLGEVPEQVQAAVDGPVVAARLLDVVPEDVDGCAPEDIAWVEPPELEVAVATPDGLYVSHIGEGAWPEGNMDVAPPPPEKPVPGGAPPGMEDDGVDFEGDAALGDRPVERFRVTCHNFWEDGRWGGGGGSSGPVFDGAGGMGGGGTSCCDRNGLATANATVQGPDGAAWALQERGGWWLAHPLGEHRVAALSWKFREGRFGGGPAPMTHVLYLDEAGEMIDEAWVGN
jgi:hypothetical protein